MLRYNLSSGPDYFHLRAAVLPLLFITAAPFLTAREPSPKARKERKTSQIALDDFFELLYHLSFPIFWGGWAFILLSYESSFDTMAYGFVCAALAALVYLGCHLYLLPAMDETARNEFWIDVEWVLFRCVVFFGLVVGTYANGSLRTHSFDVRDAISPAMSIIFQGLQILGSASGLIASSAFLRQLEKDFASNGAILNAMRKDLKIFAQACAFTMLWAVCNVALLSGHWSSILARRIFGSAFVAIWTAMIMWPSTRSLEDSARDVKNNPASREPSFRGNRLSLQIAFAVHWAVVAVAAVVSLSIAVGPHMSGA